jgi:hypothetical protein
MSRLQTDLPKKLPPQQPQTSNNYSRLLDGLSVAPGVFTNDFEPSRPEFDPSREVQKHFISPSVRIRAGIILQTKARICI